MSYSADTAGASESADERTKNEMWSLCDDEVASFSFVFIVERGQVGDGGIVKIGECQIIDCTLDLNPIENCIHDAETITL